MFSTCIHCHSSLGRNEEVETFPVGARLAFDAAKGRLWVVCPHCARWNLSPLEERWEAVEWCERAFRETPTRAATGEIGVAHRPSGLELVRIGAPARPEFASWRYGRQLDARRREAWMTRARDVVMDDSDEGVKLGKLLLYFANPPVMIGAVAAVALLEMQGVLQRRRRVCGVRVDGREIALRARNLQTMRFGVEAGGALHIDLEDERGVRHRIVDGALPLLGRLLVSVNERGGSERQVAQAVAKIEHFGTEGLVAFMADRTTRSDRPLVQALGYEQRLALEMVAHEETERASLEGELSALADTWREAEEIAAIADGLLVPADVRRRLGG